MVGALLLLLVPMCGRSVTQPLPDVSANAAPVALEEAKRAFERAHENFLAAQKLYHALADEVVATGVRMTAVYHEWQAARSAAALRENAGRRASVFEHLEEREADFARGEERAVTRS